MSKVENNILLFSITICWAASYVFIKNLPPDLSTYGYLTMVCGIAAILQSIIFRKSFRQITRATLLKSLFLSVLLTLTLVFEKLGINRLASSTASVLASLSILIVPIILILLRKFPTINTIIGALVIAAGIFVTNGFHIEDLLDWGAFFMLLCAVVTSIYTIAVDKISKEENPLLLSILQMWFSGIFSFILWFIENPSTFTSITYSNSMLSSIFILAFFAKAYAYIALMFSQKYSDPISVTIIGSTEPVVTLVLAVLIPTAFEEHFTLQSVLGVLLIMAGAIVSGISFPRRKEIPEHVTQ